MVRETTGLPFGDSRYEFTVVALLKSAHPGPFQYLQNARRSSGEFGGIDPERTLVAEAYRNTANLQAFRLASKLEGPIDAVISPPSRFNHADPYRHKIKEKWPGSRDLTGTIHKSTLVHAGEGATLGDLIAQFQYVSSEQVCAIESLLIVDDILNRGITAAAVVHVLRANGLPETCKLQLACPLWIPVAPSEIGDTHARQK